MSAIATIMLQQGYPVSGSDLNYTPVVSRLRELGALISIGHREENLPADVSLVVVSTAIPRDNPEVVEAKKRNIPVIHRADMLSKLMKRQKGIAVSGAHGKTTTTAMIGLTLLENGRDPTIIVGGYLPVFGSHAKLGKGDYLVAEADESDGSFLKLHPHIAVVTNVEDDHMDYYGSLEKIKAAFLQFINQVSPGGFAVFCTDDTFLSGIHKDLEVPVVTYGIDSNADFTARNLTLNNGITADIWHGDTCLGRLSLSVPGKHNLLNALACTAVSYSLGLSFEQIAGALRQFQGVGRRFQTVGRGAGLRVVDDYAHHPTEIKATIKAAGETGARRIIVVFQPHRYTRTRHLYREFGKAFGGADLVILDEIYGAGEKPIAGVTSDLIYRELVKRQEAHLIAGKSAIVSFLEKCVQPGDLVLTLGAGDIWKVAEELVRRLELNGGVK